MSRAFLAALLAPALAVASEPGLVAQGHRIDAMGAGTSLGVSEAIVVGPDGGTHALTISARVRVGDVQLGGSLPYASFRTPVGRDHSLGNARLWAAVALPDVGFRHWAGFRLHFDVGGPAYTWINASDELWPGAGIEAFWEARIGDDPLTWMVRAALGVQAFEAYAPFPDRALRAQAAGGVDATVWGPLGLIGEVAVQTWDTSPVEAAALARLDLAPGLRFRTGAVLPVGVWAGWTPASQPAGVREATLRFEVTLSPRAR